MAASRWRSPGEVQLRAKEIQSRTASGVGVRKWGPGREETEGRGSPASSAPCVWDRQPGLHTSPSSELVCPAAVRSSRGLSGSAAAGARGGCGGVSAGQPRGWLDGSAASPGSRRARTSALPQRVERRNGDLVVLRVDPRRHVLRVRGLSAAVFCRSCDCHGARGGSSGAPARADRLAHRLVPEHGRGDRNPAAARSVGAQRVGFKMKTAPATDGAPMRPGCGPSEGRKPEQRKLRGRPGCRPVSDAGGFPHAEEVRRRAGQAPSPCPPHVCP